MRSTRLPLCFVVGLLVACGSDEPVLPGVVTPRLQAQEPTAAPTEPEAYERPAGVLVDVQYLCSHPLTTIRGEVLDQLGRLTESSTLPAGQGEELVLERGALRVVDDRIYMIRLPLPEPMRRADVLRVVGLPPQVGETILTHREYRLNHERGFRRIRMKRQSRNNELVTEVELWHFIPGEHIQRR